MALDDIFNALDEQADKEIEQLLSDAQDQAAAIAAEAEDQAAAIQQRVADATEKATRERASRSVNAARLESKRRLAAVKEESIRQVFQAAADKLATARSQSDYANVFGALAAEATGGLAGNLEVLVDSADAALAERTAADLGLDVTIKPEISTSGGLIVRTGGGRIMRRNTFEDRLDKADGLIQADVAEILFQ